jgi:hypothetical protein
LESAPPELDGAMPMTLGAGASGAAALVCAPALAPFLTTIGWVGFAELFAVEAAAVFGERVGCTLSAIVSVSPVSLGSAVCELVDTLAVGMLTVGAGTEEAAGAGGFADLAVVDGEVLNVGAGVVC